MKGKASFDAMWARRQLDAIEFLFETTHLSHEARDSMRREVLNKLEEMHGAKPFERPFPVEFELDQNGACAPSRMTPPNRPWSWIASLTKRRVSTPPLPALRLVAPQRRPLGLNLRQ